jgi:DNA-binding GntR family transcriptional regulator
LRYASPEMLPRPVTTSNDRSDAGEPAAGGTPEAADSSGAPGRGVRTGAALAALLSAFRADLEAGSYHPRERLVEADLVARYGTTRAAVRDALIQLTSEGIVERLPNRGARVRAMSMAEALEVAELRRILESFCAARAAELATPAEIAELQDLAGQLTASAHEVNANRYLVANARFHTLIHAMARHETAAALLRQFQQRPIDRFFPQEFVANPPPAASVDEHERITAAIAAHDPRAAEAAMFDHLTSLIAALHRYEPRTAVGVLGIR